MNSNNKTAIIVGALFLIAMFATINPFTIFLASILGAPVFLINISKNITLLIIVMLLELCNGVAVVGIAVMMFPILRKHNERLSLGYVVCRIIEAAVCIVAAFILLYLIIIAGATTLLLEARNLLLNLLLPIFFSISALIFYYILYQSKLIPRFMSVWGFIAGILVLIANLIGTLGDLTFLFVLPIIVNEIFLGIWLVVKGFNEYAIASG